MHDLFFICANYASFSPQSTIFNSAGITYFCMHKTFRHLNRHFIVEYSQLIFVLFLCGQNCPRIYKWVLQMSTILDFLFVYINLNSYFYSSLQSTISSIKYHHPVQTTQAKIFNMKNAFATREIFVDISNGALIDSLLSFSLFVI